MLSGEPINGLLDSRVSHARYHMGINTRVAQLVRVPPLQDGSCEFKSRREYHNRKAAKKTCSSKMWSGKLR